VKKFLALGLALLTFAAGADQPVSVLNTNTGSYVNLNLSGSGANLPSVGATTTSDCANYSSTTGALGDAGGPCASGTVTSFSAGSLSPLFTTSVATASTTPALTFSLTSASTGTLFGNFIGSTGAPSFTAASTIPLSSFGGGTGLTGYLYGNGSSAWTASTTIPTTSLSGTVTNAQLANSSTTVNGQTCTLGSTCTAIQMGTFGSTPNANGGSISTNTLTLQPANSTNPGGITSANYNRIVGHVDAAADFGMVGDHKVAYEITTTGTQVVATASNATINCPNSCASTPFASTDVGKRITIRGAGTNGATYVGTISAFNSTTSVNVSPNPATTVTATTSVAYAVQWGTDNTTACASLVSYVNGLAYPGVHVYFPPSATNRWACPSPLLFTQGAVLVGQGMPANQDAGNYAKAGGTYLVWWGTNNDGGTAFNGFVQFSAITANNQTINGAGAYGIGIDCRNGDQNPCATGLRLIDVTGFDFRSVFVVDALNAFDLGTANMTGITASTGRGIMDNIGARQLDNTNTPQSNVSTAVSLTPTTIAAGSSGQVMTAAGSQSISIAAANGFFTPGYFWFTANNGSVYYINCQGGGGTTTLTSCGVSTDAAGENPTMSTGANIVQASPNNGSCWMTEGTSTTNTNLYTVNQGRWSYGTNYGPACFEFHNADSANLYQQVMNGGNSTNDGAINRVRRPGVRFEASAVSGAFTSRNIHFYDGDAGGPSGGGVVAMGLTSTGTLQSFLSGPNYWDRYQVGNGDAMPVIEGVTASATQMPVGPIFEWTGNGTLSGNMGSNGPGCSGNSLASTAATEVVIPGTLVKLPPQWAQTGLQICWDVGISKTAAGTDTHIIKAHYGTTGAVGTDAAFITTAASSAGTAAIDTADIKVCMTLPSTGASVTPAAMVLRTHNGAGYGALAATALTLAAINTGTAQEFMYLGLTTSATGETNVVNFCKTDVPKAALN
jgi:hypothetical protein